ncbi:hypothetical protein [Litorihabitans aurantiacus]|uniref:hypothetical protein n=1 Tax=Litorihabitans aurantiacus TaxID=1930061 RepID=UPI0024E05F26|nr:hypothetical protein [Litorihabitans aurantiacus]
MTGLAVGGTLAGGSVVGMVAAFVVPVFSGDSAWVAADAVSPEGPLTPCRLVLEPGGHVWEPAARYDIHTDHDAVLGFDWRWQPDPSGNDPGAGMSVSFDDDASAYVTWEESRDGRAWMTMPVRREDLESRPDGTVLVTLELDGQPIATCPVPIAELTDA